MDATQKLVEKLEETDAEHRRVSSGGYCKCSGGLREAQEERDLAQSHANSGHPPGRRKWVGLQRLGNTTA